MIEIIPNWHPVFVHFTVALISTSIGCYILSYFVSPSSFLSTELEVVARWCLWIGTVATIGTVLAGLHAYNTVNHNATSHIAMTNHRNWALITATSIFILAYWSEKNYLKKKPLNLLFITALLIAQTLVAIAAWKGGELVYRHGIGVIPSHAVETMGANHHHNDRSDHHHE